MTQWGSKDLGDQGYSYEEILRNFYGSEITFDKAPVVSGVPVSFPGDTLQVGSNSKDVRTIQSQLNAISKSYPAIPKVKEDGIYGQSTADAVKEFQSIFGLPQSGSVDFKTWYFGHYHRNTEFTIGGQINKHFTCLYNLIKEIDE